jgi:NTP pyrophosphatase (non-canonical NTP hydrolase)
MDVTQPTLSGLEFPEEGARVLPLKPPSLSLKEFQRWARRQSVVIQRRTPSKLRNEALVLAQAVKLGEEVGELYAELLGRIQLQRADKVGKFSDESVAEELADVLICASVLAGMIGVDVTQAVGHKIDVIEARNRRIAEETV